MKSKKHLCVHFKETISVTKTFTVNITVTRPNNIEILLTK